MAKPTKAQLTDNTVLVLTNCTRSPYTRPLEKGEILRPEHRMQPGSSCTIRKGFHDLCMRVNKPYSALVGQRKLVIKDDPMLVESPEQLQNGSNPVMPADLKENPAIDTVNGPKTATADTKDVVLADVPADAPVSAPPTSSKKNRGQ